MKDLEQHSKEGIEGAKAAAEKRDLQRKKDLEDVAKEVSTPAPARAHSPCHASRH